MTISAYPLQWPVGWKRTGAAYRRRAAFGKKGRNDYKRELSVSDGTLRLRQQLQMMGIPDHALVISTNLALRLDGLPRSDQREPADPGACAYWLDAAGNSRCMAIDLYDRVADNLAAIAATLEAMRAIERHGGADIQNRAFTGFVALPSGSTTHWSDVLGVPATASRPDIEAAYRRLRSQHHRDRGGDGEQFHAIQKAYEESNNA